MDDSIAVTLPAPLYARLACEAAELGLPLRRLVAALLAGLQGEGA